DELQVGDGILFYHSSCEPPGIAGIAHVSAAGRPDPSQFDARSEYHDPAATRASRAALLPEILAGDALVLATHIAGFGRLRQAGARLRWVPA
ncbi:MAG TPA: EVE domain-containing protein, partial [Kouleothrix sp.]|nr:EVE domain-containing protein [Kouleothrix sp.]